MQQQALTAEKKGGFLIIVDKECRELEKCIEELGVRLEEVRDDSLIPIAHAPGEDGANIQAKESIALQRKAVVLRYKALQRARHALRTGTYYGVCCSCRKFVDFEHLKEVPEATHCVSCITPR
ncbi:MAG: hypothetical protein AAB631_03155 [Patescibacteria group bacterium]